MGDRWGPEGPPDEAYSRVSRDLEAVTAAFAAYLGGLRDQLLARFVCRVRPATGPELQRLGHGTRDRDEVDVYAVEPADPGAATLLVDRYLWEGGTSVSLAAGRSAASEAPDCFCDACDEDSDEMIDTVDRFVRMVGSGFREFRRPVDPDAFGRAGNTPRGWLEVGCEWAGGHTIGASAGVRGEVFTAEWGPWPARPQS